MVGLLEVVARLEVLSEEERRREEWKRVEEAGWEVVRRAKEAEAEVEKEKKKEEEEEVRIGWDEEEEEEKEEEEEEEVRIGWDEEEEEEEEEEVRIGWDEEEEDEEEEEEEVRIGWEEEDEEEEEVRVGWWMCQGPCGRELEINGNNFYPNPNTSTGFFLKCKACFMEKVVVPKGLKVCTGGCRKVLEENADNFPLSKASKTGFSKKCKTCCGSRRRKKELSIISSNQRCKGECGQILKLCEENFHPCKGNRSGFNHKCRSCKNAEDRAKRDAGRGGMPKRQKRVRPEEYLPDGHQRCMGECGRVLQTNAENFARNKVIRSGFRATCKMCINADYKARTAARKRA